MKLGLPLLTTDMSGKLGGLVAAKARGGVLYARSRVRPSNPRSNLQTAIRAVLASIAASWQSTLTDVQRAAWAAIAPSSSSGIDAYIKANAVAIQCQIQPGSYPVLAAPSSPALETPYQFAIDPVIDNSAHSINLTPPDVDDRLCGYAVYLSPPQNSSRVARQFPYQLAGFIASDTTGLTSIVVPAARVGAVGKIQYVKIVALGFISSGGDPSGTVGIPQEYRIAVTA